MPLPHQAPPGELWKVTTAELETLQQLVETGGTTNESVNAAIEDDPSATRVAASLPPFGSGGMAALRAMLAEGQRSAAFQVIGDSTGNATDEWPYLFAQYLGNLYPSYTVKHHLFNETTNLYTTTTIQTGTDGSERCWVFPTDATFTAFQPDAEFAAPTTDWDVRVKVSLANKASVGSGILVSKFGGGGSRSFYFVAAPDSGTGTQLELYFTTDGSAQIGRVSTAKVTLTNNVVKYLRFTLDVDNGAGGHDVKFWHSADGVTWTQLGSTVTNAGTVAVFDSTHQWDIGGRGGSLPILGASIYEVEIRDGIDGPVINNRNIDSWIYNSGTTNIQGAPVLSLVNASVSGYGLDEINAETPALMIPDYGQSLVMVSLSHNDLAEKGRAWLAKYSTLVTNIQTRLGTIPRIVFVTQNPTADMVGRNADRTVHRAQFMSWAAQNGHGAIDAWRAFREDGRPIEDLLVSPQPNVHPNPAGSLVWMECVKQHFLAGTP